MLNDNPTNAGAFPNLFRHFADTGMANGGFSWPNADCQKKIVINTERKGPATSVKISHLLQKMEKPYHTI